MVRRISLLVVLALLVGLGNSPVVRGQDKGDLAKKLEKKITLANGIDANTPLKDALEFLAEGHGLKIVVDTKAFDKAGIQKVEEQPVQLKPQKNVELGKVLQMVLDQTQGTYRIEKDRLVVQPKGKK